MRRLAGKWPSAPRGMHHADGADGHINLEKLHTESVEFRIAQARRANGIDKLLNSVISDVLREARS